MRRNSKILCLAFVALVVVACGQSRTNDAARGDADSTQAYDSASQTPASPANPQTTEAMPASATDHPADNSGVNTRDANGNTLTPVDQSNAPADVSTTQAIRKALMADKSLSTNAHNIKIITKDGMVTLRGPVKNDREKTVIQQKATEIAGANHVQNELEITG